jgi:hypothetical protein
MVAKPNTRSRHFIASSERNAGNGRLGENQMSHVKLTATYFLTTDHAKSRRDQPVLFNKATGQAYLPNDALMPYESWPMMPASLVVNKMASWRNFSGEERRFIEQFLGLTRQGPSSSANSKIDSRYAPPSPAKWASR